ncbi:MAG: N-acetylneuraminate synthase family protein [Alphaproteobacteria bacterium]
MTSHTFHVGARPVGAGEPVFVIAEIGVNHDGDEDTCARLIDAGADAGADAAKLQIVEADESYVAGTESHRVFSDRALSMAALDRLMAHAAARGIILFATPGDFSSLQKIVDLNMPAIKISSGLLTNSPLIERAARTGLPMILSTGMADLDDVRAAITSARAGGAENLAVLQCTSIYPTPPAQVNLKAMQTLAGELDVPVGYSDHSLGETACLTAVALGATIIEKHITLDKGLPGADHHLSAEPGELARLVAGIRTVEEMLGSPEKTPEAEERARRNATHRCLVARRDIAAGEPFDEENLGLKRPLPGTAGLGAGEYDRVLGGCAARDLKTDEPVTKEDITS